MALKRKALIKKFLTIFIPLVCIVVLLSWVVYYFHHIKTQEDVLRGQEVNLLSMQKEFVQHTIQSIISDINVIASHQELKDLIHQELKDLNITQIKQKEKSRLPSEFLSFSKYKGIYDQIRILDNTGMEIIRVDLRENQPFLVPDDKLQFKGHRYYIKDTNKLNKGEIFMSPLDLNIERGEIEQPLKPSLRFGMPIFNQNGEKQGVLILNYLGNKLINDLERLSVNSPGHLMLLNAGGYWLKGMQPEDEWGFMFKERYNLTLENQNPTIWEKILQNENGQILNEDGLVTFIKIYPLKEGIKSTSGSAKPFQESIRDLSSDEYFWIIQSHVLPRDLHKRGESFVFILFCTDFVFLVMLGFVSWQLIVANERRRLTEESLRKANLGLEDKVKRRTEELSNTNIDLKKEIEDHNKALSEKNKIESQLHQAQKMEAIGTLTGGIAHDFNNILGIILGNAEMANITTSKDHPAKHNIDQVLSASNRAKDLVKRLLTFSRQEKGEKEPFYLCCLVDESMKTLRSIIPKSVKLEGNISPECRDNIDECLMVHADPTQIHQLLMNLCVNAVDAMGEEGTLTISVDEFTFTDAIPSNRPGVKPGTYEYLTVSDTGHGMNPELIDRIFDPFFTTKEVDKGTGLGLAVVQGIVKNHDGYLFVESELSQGTTFHIYFPTTSQKTPPINKFDEDFPLPTGKERVLFIDDEEMLADVGKSMLEQLGYSVTTQTKSNEALELFKNDPNRFDLVITDQAMPNIPGFELAKQLLQVRADIPIILCTGYSSKVDKEKSRQIGIREFALKPLDIREIAILIRQVLDEKHSS